MNLYLIKRKDDAGWGEAVGFVIRAESENMARRGIVVNIPFGTYGDEGPEMWLDAERTECVALAFGVAGPQTIILRDFRNG